VHQRKIPAPTGRLVVIGRRFKRGFDRLNQQ
jgi:hypothetical protein